MDSVYALDANTGAQLWAVNFTDPVNGITPLPCETDGQEQISCAVYPYYGVTGTPVIAPVTQTMYLVSRTWNTQTQAATQMLHAIDITTGAEKFGGPVVIQGSVSGTGAGSVNGIINFDPLADVQRPGLLLEKNNQTGAQTVYIGWSGAAHGWMMGYDAKTLQQTSIFNTSPDAIRSGVWQSGNGLAADVNGYIYASTGDGLFDVNSGGRDYGDTLLKLDGDLNVVDYFTPKEAPCRYQYDFDVSSSGPVILPKQPGANPDEVVESGKGGNPCDGGAAPIYLLDRDNLGKFNANSDNSIQDVPGAGAGYWSSPAYWRYGNQAAIYYAGVAVGGPQGTGDNLKMYTLTNGLLSSSPVAQSANVFPIGATPTVTGNGTTNGIVWATERQEILGLQPGQFPQILYAYDATNLATLYNSNQNPARDTGGCANKFQVPVVANGKVYVGTQNELDVYGLLGNPPAAPVVSLSSPCYTFNKQQVGTSGPPRYLTLTNIGKANLTLSQVSIRGVNASDYAQVNNCPITLAPNAQCTVKITFTPSALGPRTAQIIFTDNAAGSPQNTQVIGLGI